jgi:adenylosuccinate lyase
MADKEVMRYASPERLDAEFDDTYHTKHVDTIFRRVFD